MPRPNPIDSSKEDKSLGLKHTTQKGQVFDYYKASDKEKALFRKHIKGELTDENFDFIDALRTLNNGIKDKNNKNYSDEELVNQELIKIYETYIKAGADRQVNLDSSIRNELDRIREGISDKSKKFKIDDFEKAACSISNLIREDVMGRFMPKLAEWRSSQHWYSNIAEAFKKLFQRSSSEPLAVKTTTNAGEGLSGHDQVPQASQETHKTFSERFASLTKFFHRSKTGSPDSASPVISSSLAPARTAAPPASAPASPAPEKPDAVPPVPPDPSGSSGSRPKLG